jgi:RNA polymerase sigma factor (sigma-70 family)
LAIAENAENLGLVDMFVAYRDALVDLAARIVRCRCRAEDIVQDIVVKLLESSVDVSVRQPASYLFQMVRNRAIDLTRRTEFETRHMASDEKAMLEHESGACPEGIVAGRESLHSVANALEQLPTRTRRVFELHRLEGYTQKEIALQFRVSPTLVNFMVRDAHTHCLAALTTASPQSLSSEWRARTTAYR